MLILCMSNLLRVLDYYFFCCCDSHLPENIVAAFAKRLARLSLVAPPEDIHIILMFIGNLILRHPGLKLLINNPNGENGMFWSTLLLK